MYVCNVWIKLKVKISWDTLCLKKCLIVVVVVVFFCFGDRTRFRGDKAYISSFFFFYKHTFFIKWNFFFQVNPKLWYCVPSLYKSVGMLLIFVVPLITINKITSTTISCIWVVCGSYMYVFLRLHLNLIKRFSLVCWIPSDTMLPAW